MKTLKISLFIFAALIISKTGSAQTSNFTIGIRAGANYNNLYGAESISNSKGKAGFTAGAFARIGDRLYIEPGANFNVSGARFDLNAQKYDVKFNQLQVPLLIGYKFISDDKFNFHAAVGPEADFNLKKPASIQNFAYKNFNSAGKVEAGVDVGNLTIDLSYSRGLSKINKGLDQSTGMYNLSVGFRFF